MFSAAEQIILALPVLDKAGAPDVLSPARAHRIDRDDNKSSSH
jgi:hypothetical protein